MAHVISLNEHGDPKEYGLTTFAELVEEGYQQIRTLQDFLEVHLEKFGDLEAAGWSVTSSYLVGANIVFNLDWWVMEEIESSYTLEFPFMLFIEAYTNRTPSILVDYWNLQKNAEYQQYKALYEKFGPID